MSAPRDLPRDLTVPRTRHGIGAQGHRENDPKNSTCEVTSAISRRSCSTLSFFPRCHGLPGSSAIRYVSTTDRQYNTLRQYRASHST
eukprot:2027827-Rhodomonas_salina.1